MNTAPKLDYRRLQVSWFPMWLGLIFLTGVCVAGVLLLILPTRCEDHPFYSACYNNAELIKEITLAAMAVCAVLGLLASLFVNGSCRRVVAKAFGVTYLNDNEPLTRRVHGLAQQLNLPLPSVGTMSAANAFAVGSNPKQGAVVLGLPLIQALDDDELDAVIGHELGHIAFGDMQRMQRTMGYQRMLIDLTSVGTFVAVRVIASRNRYSAYLGYLYGVLLRHTVFFLTEIALKDFSRKREYYADAVGAILTSPDAMQRALTKVHRIDGRQMEEKRFGHLMFRRNGSSHLFSTHPSLEDRCRALKSQRYIKRTLRIA